MNAADRKRLIALLNRINQREPQKEDDLLLLARGYEDMALGASRAATAAARAEPDEALRVALTVWLDSHGEADIEERLAEAANEWLDR